MLVLWVARLLGWMLSSFGGRENSRVDVDLRGSRHSLDGCWPSGVATIFGWMLAFGGRGMCWMDVDVGP